MIFPLPPTPYYFKGKGKGKGQQLAMMVVQKIGAYNFEEGWTFCLLGGRSGQRLNNSSFHPTQVMVPYLRSHSFLTPIR